jgi:hypothetical protein
MDYPKDLVIINIKDVDGITVGGSNYKIANGANIILHCTSYPKISFDNYLNNQENLSTPITATKTLTSSLGPVKFSGNSRPTITLDAVITVSNTTPTRTQYAAMTGNTDLSFYLLYNIWRYPHRMYLRDTIQSTEGVLIYPNLDLPMNILMSADNTTPAIDRTDLLNQKIFNVEGVPVILKSINFKTEYVTQNKDTLTNDAHFEYSLTFLVDNYGD